MSKCQYAVPLILPSPLEKGSQHKELILFWALQAITRDFYEADRVTSESFIDIRAPMIACLNIGKEVTWKNKLVNRMLSQQQETFWHKGLISGKCNQIVSQGMVEVACNFRGAYDDNIFTFPVIFVNVRSDDTSQNNLTSDSLIEFSSVCCIFVENVGQDLFQFLQGKGIKEKVVLVILYREGQDRELKQKCKNLKEKFNLEKHQVICKSKELTNFISVEQQLKRFIVQMIQPEFHNTSLSDFVNHAKREGKFEVDDKECYIGHMAAESILKDVDKCNVKEQYSAKGTILPCNADLKSRQEIAALDKELCRQRKIVRGDTTAQNYAFSIKEQKWQLQLNQLQYPISSTFRYFLQCLVGLNTEDKKYFLQSLKLGLNKRSTHMLQPLYEEYEKCRAAGKMPDRDAKLKTIESKIAHGSLGLEHFFRELAIMYENMMALREKSGRLSDMDVSLDILVGHIARLLIEGTAIELLDSDAMDVPISWLNAVFYGIEDCSKSTVFKVSALGAQSSGKSTLLNAVYGSNFPVSSGRCTRGAYMQLVKVDDALKEVLPCSYVAVIDSEGLMSRSRIGDMEFDNEISTLIIGLSDLTLFVIKGEGSEMQDVLPLAIHVFLKMNIVGEHQAVHFVHQNMGAVDAASKGSTEIEAFVRNLNAKTLAAAKEARQSNKYSEFNDILNYDPKTDNCYVPTLWNGSPPMGKVNPHYSKAMHKMKSSTITNIRDIQKTKKKMLGNFIDLAKRLEELWNVIKYQHFTLSFKNILAVEAHSNLTKIFDEAQWNLKRQIQDILRAEKRAIEVQVLRMGGGNIDGLIDTTKRKIVDHLYKQINYLENSIVHYFQCAGCKECSKEVKNRHLLANNILEFHEEIRALYTTLKNDVESSMSNLEVKLKTDERMRKLSAEIDGILKQKIHEAIQTGEYVNLDENQLENVFGHLWEKFCGEISQIVKPQEENEDIEAAIQRTIRDVLRSDSQLFEKLLRNQGKRWKQDKLIVPEFTVNPRKHMAGKSHWLDRPVFIGERDVRRLRMTSERITDEVKEYFKMIDASEGTPFNQREAEILIKEIVEQINIISDERFNVTDDYKADLIHHIERRVSAGFSDLHQKYCIGGSVEALVAGKKQRYCDIFVGRMGHANMASKFCETVLNDMIVKNVDEQLSCIELLQNLRVHYREVFRNIKSLQTSVMIDLIREDKFEYYLDYISNYKRHMKDKIINESTIYFKTNSRLKKMAHGKLDQMISTMLEALEDTVRSSCTNKNFIQTFLSKVGEMISHGCEASDYLELDVGNHEQFINIVRRKLQGETKEMIVKNISSWDVSAKLNRKGFTDFVFREIVGCKATCPFCTIPCDAHSGGKTHGKHSSTWHRPQGLGGYFSDEGQRLLINDCCFDIASPTAEFRPRDAKLVKKWTPYSAYQKVFPDWKIFGNADPDTEKYWKWVLMRHNSSFAEHYGVNEAQIPWQWNSYEKEEILNDIEVHYHIEIDR